MCIGIYGLSEFEWVVLLDTRAIYCEFSINLNIALSDKEVSICG